jgi:threonyl-tRNA synthetase
MISIKLADGSPREIKENISALELAKEISNSLAKNTLAVEVNSELRDLSYTIKEDDQIKFITKDSSEALKVLRHSAAHVMADAILALFPGTQLTIGPVVEDGFYYDILLPEGKKISSSDFAKIEQQIKKITKSAHPFIRCTASYSKANEHYESYKNIDGGNNPFKQEIIEDIKKRNEPLSFYKHGNFIDLCRGPHVPHTGWLKHIKLTKVAGSYWRADANNPPLTRIYGTAFFDKKELDAHLMFIEEAKKRDHRILGQQLELFTFIEDAPGLPFFYPKGTTLYNSLTKFMSDLLNKHSYKEVKTPLILSEKMWHKSGHYNNYMENMFFTKLKLKDKKQQDRILDNVDEERPMALKPMNCPGHLLLYKSKQYSYNDLPLRIAEMGLVHRRELSGVRHGLFRVQAFTQDDAHHFCTPEQIQNEIRMLIRFFKDVYKKFDLNDVQLELSTRPEKSIGSDDIWDKAETALSEALKLEKIDFKINAGDGAFYGPKIDFHILDALNRSWQCGTIQLDFSMPERFDLNYIGADGKKHTPVMIHRACFGSIERFLGILTEHYAGAFPVWLAPVQVKILTISSKFIDYAQSIIAELKQNNVRAEIDASNERIGYKIRQASINKIPYLVTIGEKEQTSKTMSIRARNNKDLGNLNIDELLKLIKNS